MIGPILPGESAVLIRSVPSPRPSMAVLPMITESDQFPAEITVWRKGDDLKARISSLDCVTLPNGSTAKLLRDGAVGRFGRKTGEHVLKLRYQRRWYPVPSMEEVQAWTLDSVCETPDGRTVEPDAPDSWLSLLKLV